MNDASNESNPLRFLLTDSLRSGTLAGIAMIPFGILFTRLGLRINEFGRLLFHVLFGEVTGPAAIVLHFVMHIAISWGAALPLLFAFRHIRGVPRIVTGLAYGAVFYVLLNALALPAVFGRPSPFTLGWSTIYPSLVVHIVFGVVVGLAAKRVVPAATPSAELAR